MSKIPKKIFSLTFNQCGSIFQLALALLLSTLLNLTLAFPSAFSEERNAAGDATEALIKN
jgi:hypothetical protein